ncbi:Tmemb cc2 domain containing protein [Trichuris trichiura]|uniref:Tmemb cc2 domain containing protein n=1 Tax=Trichuris trichiura TaxID=36087 RepID=A0A077Z3X7_TRITR|nr:Tmemb cc2 domain containing protein [Trichuris trichiura]
MFDSNQTEEAQSQYMGSQSSDNDSHAVEPNDEQERLLRKIEIVGEKIKAAVKAKEADVDEFLRMSANLSGYPLHSPQVMRIRLMFNKKNKKSTQLINSLQKKLLAYQSSLQELEESGSLRRGFTETVLNNVGQGLKSVINVPKDLTKRLLRSKSGSADNLPFLSAGAASHSFSPKFVGPERKQSVFYVSPKIDRRQQQGETNEEKVQSGQQMSETGHATELAQVASLTEEVGQLRSDHCVLSENVSSIRNQMLQEYSYFHGALHEEKCRYQRLEDQLNDTIELHQAEVLNLKQEIETMEGRLRYQFRDQLQDLQDVIARSQDKNESIEKAVKDLQQAVGLENLSNVDAGGQALRALLLFLQIIIFLLFAMWQVVSPCFRTRTRLVTTITSVVVGIFVLKNWDALQGKAYVWFLNSSIQSAGENSSQT